MRAEAGFAAVQLGYVVPGLLALIVLGLVSPRGPRELLVALGPAYLCGIAIVLPAISAVLVLGLPFTATTAALVVLVASALLSWPAYRARRDISRSRPEPRAPRGDRALLITAAVVIGGYVAFAALSLRHVPVLSDNAFIWSHRASALFFFDHLDPGYFRGAPYARNHLDYPLLRSLLQALDARARGALDLRMAPVELYLVWGAFLWTAAFLLRRAGGRPAAWVGVLVAIAVLPAVREQTATGFADPLVASFVALGALSAALWIQSSQRAYAVLAALMLGAAANTKNEGLVAAVAVALASGLAVGRRDGLRALLAAWPAAVVLVASIAPWQLWLKFNHVVNADTLSLGQGLSPTTLADRADRARLAWTAILGALANADALLLLFPLFVAVAIGCVLFRRAPMLAGFYLGATAVMLVALIWVYWISTLEIHQHLAFSVDRTIMDLVLVGGVGAAHLLARLDAGAGAEAGPRRAATPRSRRGGRWRIPG